MLRNSIQIFNYSVSNKSDGVIDVHIDGDIVDAATQELMKNWWGDETSTSYRSFRNQVETINPQTVNVYVNSTGGHVGDAMAIHDYLTELESKGITVNRRGRGIVASAATYIVMGNNSELSENSFFMIHNVSLVAVGDINSVENQVRAARKFNDRIRDFYANNTSNPPETIAKWMNSETWMNAQEAKDRGFVKNISASVNFQNTITEDKFPFQNTAILNQYNSQIKIDDMSKNLSEIVTNAMNACLEKLGLKNKEDQTSKDTINEFATQIEEAIKNAGTGVTEEKVGEIVTNALTEFKPAFDVSNFATKDEIKNFATKEDVRNLATTEAVAAAINDSKNEIIAAINDRSGSSSSGSTGSGNNNKGAKPRNKYSGLTYEEVKVA